MVDKVKSEVQLVDMILLDSGNPKLALKELGDTVWKSHWIVSRKIDVAVSKPVFLTEKLNVEYIPELLDFEQA